MNDDEKALTEVVATMARQVHKQGVVIGELQYMIKQLTDVCRALSESGAIPGDQHRLILSMLDAIMIHVMRNDVGEQ